MRWAIIPFAVLALAALGAWLGMKATDRHFAEEDAARDKQVAEVRARYKAESDRFDAAKANAFRNCQNIEHGYPVMGFGPSVVCLASASVLRVEVMP